jgi:hypothetical protein
MARSVQWRCVQAFLVDIVRSTGSCRFVIAPAVLQWRIVETIKRWGKNGILEFIHRATVLLDAEFSTSVILDASPQAQTLSCYSRLTENTCVKIFMCKINIFWDVT